MNLLKQILSFLPQAHQQAIREVMATIRANSEDLTDREIQFEAKRLVARIKDSKRISSPIYPSPGDVVDSQSHNQNIEGAYIDLKGLYSETGHLVNVQNKQTAAIESDFNKAKSAIFKLINDARVFALRNRKPEYDDIKLVNFNIARNSSKIVPTANIDDESRLLKLPEIAKVRNHLARRGTKVTKVTATVDSSGTIGQLSKQFVPSLATDGKTESFWAEVILADAPIQTQYVRWGNTLSDTPSHETIHGPIGRLNIDFGNAEPVNQIKVLPFSPQPVRVLEITYRPSKSSKIRFPISNFDIEESLDWMEFNFDTVFCSDVEIVFVQESYRDFIVHVPKHVLFATDFLSRLLDERSSELGNVPDVKNINLGGNFEIYEEAMSDLAGLLTQKDIVKSPSTEIDLAGKYIMSIGETLANFSPDLQGLLEEVSAYTDNLPEESANEIKTFNKIEYVFGAREVQANFVLYSPIGQYESEKFLPAATVANIELEVDEKHPIVFGDFGPEKHTSTEWSIELSEDRIIPIFPANQVTEGFLRVEAEFLVVNPFTRKGKSRLSALLSHIILRENGKLLVDNVDYSTEWESNEEGRLVITVFESAFDKNRIYTIDYFATPASKSIDVLSKFKSKRIPKPELYEGTDSDQKIETQYYPSINYGIINSLDFEPNDERVYTFEPPSGAYNVGQVRLSPIWIGSGDIEVVSGNRRLYTETGAGVPWEISNFVGLSSSHLADPYGLYIKLNDIPNAIYEIESIVNTGELLLATQPRFFTGDIGGTINGSYFSGNIENYIAGATGQPLTGDLRLPFSIEIVYKNGDEIFGFDNLEYQPIEVKVGGQTAKNITNYTDIEQPAFVITEGSDSQFEYIHDGKSLYFNQAILETEVQVNYKWLTKYVKVKCTLRSNKIVNPTLTPQVNEYSLLLNTTIL
jgi:hypothetical protein